MFMFCYVYVLLCLCFVYVPNFENIFLPASQKGIKNRLYANILEKVTPKLDFALFCYVPVLVCYVCYVYVSVC